MLLALAGASAWLVYRIDQSEPRAARPLSHEPDSYMEGFTRTAMDESGQVKTHLYAERMFHYPDDDSTRLTRPRIEILDDGPPWYAAAETGFVDAKGEVVLLRGEVRIWRDNASGGRAIEVITTRMRVLPTVRYAETDDPVTLVTPESVTHAVGMRGDLRSNRLELLKQVRTRYETRPSRKSG
ncbi:MAG: LPS export ABC transporter periplasmic protein LptC [Gammaproteobacteria bacterium]